MSSPTTAPPNIEPPKFLRWHRRVLGICLIVFAFEIGLFLTVFPWLSAWSMNWVPVHSERFSDLWMSPYLRGFISGLGLLNIYIALAEAARQLRSFFPRQPVP